MQSIFWHDYETFGADTRRDMPCQFAGVRTDLNLNIIGEPETFYAKPVEDYLPAVEACLVTGITPQHALRHGLTESVFARRIHEIFSTPETCVAGYNSVRFDDEVTRNLFYRNFYDPYEREWKSGNSRWDLIDVVRLTHALRPEGIHWPTGDDGKVSFRLEKLTEANDISHEAAHDAMSDVYATIAIAKLVKQQQPALYDYAFKLRTKAAVKAFFDDNARQPFLHVSSKIPADRGCIAMMFPLMFHPINPNAVICFDLRQDPKVLFDQNSDQLRERLYSKTEYDASGNLINERPALKLVHLNKCPMVAPASMIKVIPEQRLHDWDLDLASMRRHLTLIREKVEHLGHIRDVFDQEFESSETDPDLMIYSGGFFNTTDKQKMSRLRDFSQSELEGYEASFDDERIDKMLFRYKARNFADILSAEEREAWSEHCRVKLLEGLSGSRTFKDFAVALQQAATGVDPNSDKAHLLEELRVYAESIYPY